MNRGEMYPSKLEKRQLTGPQTPETAKPRFFSCLYRFRDIEDVIQLAHRLQLPFFNSKLFAYEGHYYLTIVYPDQRTARGHDWGESIVLEYGERTPVTVHTVMEYGTHIMADNAVGTLRNYFAV